MTSNLFGKRKERSVLSFGRLATVAAVLVTGVSVTHAESIEAIDIAFSNFDSPLIQKNGNAATTATGALRLTSDHPAENGSAFLNLPIHLGENSDFTSWFDFQITSADANLGNRSDGFTFLISWAPNGLGALGGRGGDLGYGNYEDPSATPITNSVAIEFDTYQNSFDPNDHHIAVDVGGDITTPKALATTSTYLDDGAIRHALIRYFGQGDLLSVQLFSFDGILETSLSTKIDIPLLMNSGLGLRDVYFGFTGSTGAGFANHDILNWRLTVPEPESLLLFSIGLLSLFGMMRPYRPSDRPSGWRFR